MARQSIGQKRPFLEEHIQLIRVNLQVGCSNREIALFELALCTCLRASDLLSLTVEQVHGQDRVPIKMKKTGRVILVDISSRARVAVRNFVESSNLGPKARLFYMNRTSYGRLVKRWAKFARLDPRNYSTHSMRKTKPSHVYKMTQNVKVAQELLGHADLSHTGAYLGIGTEEAHAIAKEHEL